MNDNEKRIIGQDIGKILEVRDKDKAYTSEVIALQNAYFGCYGLACFTRDAAFMQALIGLAKEDGIIPDLASIVALFDGEQPGDFLKIYLERLRDFVSGKAGSDGRPSVHLDFYWYVWQEGNRCEREARKGAPDFTRLAKLLAFLSKHLKDPQLKGSPRSASEPTDLAIGPNELPSGEGASLKSQEEDEKASLASATDLARFPEEVTAPEVTSLVVPAKAEAEGSGQASPGDSRNPDVLPSFDPQIEIKKRLGRGGMGEVFLGLQKHLGREVAVKRIRDLGSDRRGVERFMNEARAQSRLQHPGIAQVHDLREAQGELFLIMEYVEGKTLDEVVETRGKLPPGEIVLIGVLLTEALEAAAHEGYIHRDLKPGNVMLTEGGKVKIIDFGLALKFRNLIRTRLTEAGEVFGTPSYMSPEQLNQEENLDIQSDIWSVGALLYTLGTGEPPFTGRDFICAFRNVLTKEPMPLTELEKGFPPGLWHVISRALRKDRAERWQDYASFRYALVHHEKFASGTPGGRISEEDLRAPPKAAKPRSKRILVPVTLGLALVLGLAIALGSRLLGLPKEAVAKPRSEPAPLAASPEKNRLKDSSPTPEADAGKIAARGVPPKKAEKESSDRPEKGPAESQPASHPIAKAEPPAPRLREKLLGWAPSERAKGTIGEILTCFTTRRSEMHSYSFDGILSDLASLEEKEFKAKAQGMSPQEREYIGAHLDRARRMAEFAKGAVLTRIEEVRARKEKVTLKLEEGGAISGKVENVGPATVTLWSEDGALHAVEIVKIAREEFLPGTAAANLQIAFEALSGRSARALKRAIALSDESEEVLLYLPVLVRLARLEAEEYAKRTASAGKELLAEKRPLEGSRAVLEEYARCGAAATALADHKARILSFYAYLESDFDLARREKEALDLLVARRFSRVLAGYKETAAFPVAAQLFLGDFEKELSKAPEELLARDEWFNKGWQLLPAVRPPDDPKNHLIPGYKDVPLVLKDREGPRKLIMTKVGLRVEEGVEITLRFEPFGSRIESSHWEFLVRGKDESQNYLRIDQGTIALCQSVLMPGAKDVVLSSAPLPWAPVGLKYHTFAFLPGDEHLHVFIDGQHALSAPREDAAIPMQLALTLYHGQASIKSMEVKANASPDKKDRK